MLSGTHLWPPEKEDVSVIYVTIIRGFYFNLFRQLLWLRFFEKSLSDMEILLSFPNEMIARTIAASGTGWGLSPAEQYSSGVSGVKQP